MAKVLHITQFLSPGGLERMIWALSEDLIENNHVSEVFVYDQEGEKTLLPEFLAAGIAVHSHQKDQGFSWKIIKTLRTLIKSKKYTAIHSHDLGALIYASLANLGLNLVNHVHTQHSFIHLKKSWLHPIYEKIFCSFPDSIVVVSPHQLADYKKLNVVAKVITNGVKFPKENPIKVPIKEFRKELLAKSKFNQPGLFGPLPKIESKWILVPGRIQKSKGQTLLFDIMRELSATELAQVHFIIIGAPTNESDRLVLENFHNTLPQFQNSLSYLGFHPNPLEWISASNGVVLLSEFEGFPLVPLESLGLGIPTLLSDIRPHLFLASQASLTSLGHLEKAITWTQDRINSPLEESPEEAQRRWNNACDFRATHSIAHMTSEYIALYEKRK